MQRKTLTLALALSAALAFAGCRRASDSSLFAADAHASSLSGLATAAAPPSAPAAAADRTLGAMPSLSPLVKQLRPVVVNISTTTKAKAVSMRRRRSLRNGPRAQPFGQPGEEDDGEGQGQGQGQGGPGGGNQEDMERFFQRYFGNRGGGGPDARTPEKHGLGSGFIIGDGLVLTNNHVVEGADEIKVTTDPTAPGGMREYTGKVIGRDAQTDIALVQLDGDRGKQLPAAVLGSSDQLEVGDYVIAIGEPFGFTATVTSGIVSAKERTLRSSAFDDFIQTDASINPGNSGGPLFNLRGEVVGVNTAIISGANSIGFAIPIDLVKQELAQLRSKGRVTRGYLGVQVQPVTQEIAEAFGLKSAEGALVADVVRDAPASKAGVKKGDIVTQVNGKAIKDERHLTRTIASYSPGSEVQIAVVRDRQSKDLTLKIGTRPEEPDDGDMRGEKGDQSDQQGTDPLGLQVDDLTPDLARRVRAEPGTKGVVVTDVTPESAAAQSLEPGDIIDQVAKKPVETAADYRSAVKGLKKGDTALIHVVGRGGARYVTIHLR